MDSETVTRLREARSAGRRPMALGADLRGANLRGADLWDADLRGGLTLNGLPSGQVIAMPTADGWTLTVGCWKGTLPELRALVAQDEGWPQARGDEVHRRRPGLLALCDLVEAHQAIHADKLAAVIKRWAKK